MHDPDYASALGLFCLTKRNKMHAVLCRLCPYRSLDAIEDAVQASLLIAWERQALYRKWCEGGLELLFRCLVTVARRTLQNLPPLGVSLSNYQPGNSSGVALIENRSDARRARQLLPKAARCFGGPRYKQLEDALHLRLYTDTSDTAAAAHFGLRREQLSRARRWISVRLQPVIKE